MNSEEYKAEFKEAVAAAGRFHIAATKVMTDYPIVFWPIVLLAVYGLIRVFV